MRKRRLYKTKKAPDDYHEDSTSGVSFKSERTASWHQNAILLGRIKAGTRFVAECVVTHNDGVGVLLLQFGQQVEHGFLLLGRSGVCRLASGIKATLVADADGVAVVVQAMGTNYFFRSADFNIAIPADVVVIPGSVPSFGDVPFRDLFNGTRLGWHHCAAVDNEP